MIKDKSTRRLIIIYGIVVSLLLLIFFSFLFILFLIFLSRTRNTSNNTVHEYQYYNFNPQTNQSSEGRVTLFKALAPTEYISYNKKDDYVLISTLGSREYQCTGSCFCQYSNERRTSGSVLNRGVFTLVAAMTSYLALSKAKETFQQECEDHYRSQCAVENIMGNVKDCKPVKEKKEVPRDWRMGPEDNDSSGPKEGKYFCRGLCQPKAFSRAGMSESVTSFGCENFKMGGVVTIEITKLTRCDLRESMNSLIHAKYRREILGPYCKKVSISQVGKRKVSLCTSANNGFNPTVNCNPHGASFFVNEIKDSVGGGIGGPC